MERVALGREFPYTRSFPCATRKGSHENVRTSINLHQQKNESPGTNRYANSQFHFIPWTEQKVALSSSFLQRTQHMHTPTWSFGYAFVPDSKRTDRFVSITFAIVTPAHRKRPEFRNNPDPPESPLHAQKLFSCMEGPSATTSLPMEKMPAVQRIPDSKLNVDKRNQLKTKLSICSKKYIF